MTTAVRAALFAGIALGVVGRLSDYSVAPVRAAFVLGAPWIVVAVGVGLLARGARQGAKAGALALAVSVVAYYALMSAVEHHVGARYAVAMAVGWGVVALGVGAVFGAVGARLRSATPPGRALAAVVVGGALAGEALLFLLRGASPAFAVVLGAQLAVGVASVLVFARGQRAARLMAVAAAVAALALVVDLAVRDVLREYGWGGI